MNDNDSKEGEEDLLKKDEIDYDELDKKSQFSLQTYLKCFKFTISEWKLFILSNIFTLLPCYLEA